MKNPKSIAGILVIGALLLGTALLRAENPVGKIPYQGRLTDASNNPLSGNYSIRFSLWDASSGGGELWNETQNLSVDRGLISADLGDVTPISGSLFNSATTYLEIKVGADPAMTPRIRLLPAAYAFNAQTFQGRDFSAVVSTFGAQTVDGNKNFRATLNVGSMTVYGTVTSTSGFMAANSTFSALNAGGQVNVGSMTVYGTVFSTSGFVGVGSTLTLLNASNLALGSVPNARIDASSIAMWNGAKEMDSFRLNNSSVAKWNAAGQIENFRLDNSSVAKWNASGDIDNFRHDPSSVTMYGPVRSRSIIGIWSQVNLAANQTDLQITYVPINAAVNSVAANSRMAMPFAGIARGVIVAGSAARTAGSATFRVFKNASLIGSGPDATIDATNTQYVASNAGSETFAAGDILDIRVTTSADFAPTGQEWYAHLVVEWTE